jgi:hypothetical protein
VQPPFDNCHSPFSPTTFFEIGVCKRLRAASEDISDILRAVCEGISDTVDTFSKYYSNEARKEIWDNIEAR